MSGYGANPIFFNKKLKIGDPEHSLTPPPPTSNNISSLAYPPLSLNVDVICVLGVFFWSYSGFVIN